MSYNYLQQDSASSCSLKGILNLDKAEVIFQRLLEAVQAHSVELATVKKDVSRKADGADVCIMYKEMQDRLSSLERRVATTEAAVTIPETTVTTSHNDDGIGVGVGIDTVSSAAFRGYDVIEDSNANPEDSGEGFRGGIAMPRGAGAGIGSGAGERRAVFTVGEAVQANGQALRALLKKLDEKAGRIELTAKGEELEAALRERERAIQQWGVGRDFADSLGRAQRVLASQLAAVEGVLGTKLDKSEMHNMQAACTKVSTVSDFLDSAAERVSSLEGELKRETGERRREADATKKDLDAVLKKLPQKTDERNSRALGQKVEELKEAFVDETNAGRKSLRALRQGTDGLKKALEDLSQSSGERLRDVEACLEGAATREEVALKADARYADAALTTLRADCASRAWQTDLFSLKTTVSCLEAEHDKTRRASDLAGRFVDWFSSRGEAYEHNLGAVEKHIENLATRSVGARARPATDGHKREFGAGATPATRVEGVGDLFGLGGASRNRGGAEGRRGVPYGGSVRFTPA